MNADLENQSNKIICSHLNILNNNYDEYNCLMFKKKFISTESDRIKAHIQSVNY